MAINRKGKRSINVGGEEYLWWVDHDLWLFDESLAAHVVSASGDFRVTYKAAQRGAGPHVELSGHRFREAIPKQCGSGRFACVDFDGVWPFTPKHAAALIAWANAKVEGRC